MCCGNLAAIWNGDWKPDSVLIIQLRGTADILFNAYLALSLSAPVWLHWPSFSHGSLFNVLVRSRMPIPRHLIPSQFPLFKYDTNSSLLEVRKLDWPCG